MTAASRRGLAVIAAAIAIALAAGCGGDDEEGTPASSGTTDGAVANPPEAEPGPPEEGIDGDTAPEISDEDHEGAGPDPGTEEAEQAEGNAGGTPAGGGEAPAGDQGETEGGAGDGNQGGTGPTGGPQAFEQFCEQNPEACE